MENKLVEIARINTRETENCIFPCNAWEIIVRSDNHTPPHFHIKRNGWDVSFKIDDGEVFLILLCGIEKKIFDYMTSNVKDWLNAKCTAMPKFTNRENAALQWEQLHNPEN